MKRVPPEELLIGAHTSAAGGAPNALREGHSIGATTIQLFTSNQKQWSSRSISEEEIALWHQTREETALKTVMSHDSYLINLGSPKPDSLERSQRAFEEELKRCLMFDIDFLNFHPGIALDGGEEECLKKIVASLISLEPLFQQKSKTTRLLIETTAGQGSTVGHIFEHLGYLIQEVKGKVPLGICIDTCHIFAAGYDIRTKSAWEKTLDLFDQKVGLEHLYAFHLNDSQKELGSRVDRHAPLGEGKIGLEAFEFVMTHPKLRELPKYLETPGGCPQWEKEIALLRKFAQ